MRLVQGRDSSYHFSVEFNVVDLHEVVNSGLVFERDKTEAFASVRLAVHHDGGVYNSPILTEKDLERLVGRRARKATNEDLLGAVMLKARDGTFRVNLLRHNE